MLPIVAKSSISDVVEFLDPPLKTLPCTKTSLDLCESQSFFLLFPNVATFINQSHCALLCYFLQYEEVLLSSLTIATTILFLWILSMAIQSQN